MRKIICVALAFASAPAFAVDHGVYLGASLGHSDVKVEQGDPRFGRLTFDGGDTAYKLIGGIRIFNWLAAEASYVDLGTPDDRVAGVKAEVNPRGVAVDALGIYALGPIDVFAKGGLINWRARLRAPAISVSTKRDGTDFTYGAGAQFRLGSLAVRAEYEVFDLKDVKNADLVSVGVTWTFF